MKEAQPKSYRDLIADCVHCGFCLSACPTYASWGDEMDSPRGRIDLMKGVAEGAIALDATVVAHFDACLGCLACVPACPSGVQYDRLIEATRANVERTVRRGWADRAFRAAVFALFPYPSRLRLLAPLLAAYVRSGAQRIVRSPPFSGLLPIRLRALDAILPRIDVKAALGQPPPFSPARGRRRGRVALVAGCVARVFFPNVNAATVRVLNAEGYDVAVPPAQGCCGALSLHAGREAEARRFARRLIERFESDPAETIVVNAAGCGAMLKTVERLFDDDPNWCERAGAFARRVRDVNEFLGALEPVARRQPLRGRVAYHDACHLANAQRVRDEPRTLLASIPGIELVEIAHADQCCGSAGVYNLFEPHSAREIGERKATDVLAARPDILASPNPGCALQLSSLLHRRGASIEVLHPIELLDRSVGM